MELHFAPRSLNKYCEMNDILLVRARRWIQRTQRLFHRETYENTCAIDPGVRTPWTSYDFNERSFMDVYPDLVDTLARRHRNISYLQKKQTPKSAGTKKRKRSRQRKRKRKKEAGRKKKKKRTWKTSIAKRINRQYDKISSIARQAHNAFANHLVRHYDTIILPEFMTKKMVMKRRRKMDLPPLREGEAVNATVPREGSITLHKTTRKAMQNLAHYKFRQRLIAKALADPQKRKRVLITTEEYTTKQCPFCEFVHHKIGGMKVFLCEGERCGFVGGRDCVGAFNIGLRSIVKKEVAPVV